MDNTRVSRMAFTSVYTHYINKAEKKGRTKEEVHAIIHWLTGYDEQTLQQQIDKKVDFETFFARAPRINPNVSKITGVICGYRVEEIEDKLMQQIRYPLCYGQTGTRHKPNRKYFSVFSLKRYGA